MFSEVRPDLSLSSEIKLPDFVNEALSADESTCFDSDFEYFKTLDAIHLLTFLAYKLNTKVKSSILSDVHSLFFAFPSSKVPNNAFQTVKIILPILVKLKGKLASRLASTKRDPKITLPRFERLMSRLNATDEQKDVYSFLFVYHSSNNFLSFLSNFMARREIYTENRTASVISSADLASIFNINPVHLLSSFFPSLWVSENLVKKINSINEDIFNMTDNMKMAILGADLHYDIFISIESEILQNLISLELNFSSSEAGKKQMNLAKQLGKAEDKIARSDLSKKKRTLSDIQAEFNSVSGKGVSNFYSSLKKEEEEFDFELEKESKVKRRKVLDRNDDEEFEDEMDNDSENLFEEDEEKEIEVLLDGTQNVDELHLYKTDLEYLTDQFHFMSLKKRISEINQLINHEELFDNEDDPRSDGHSMFFERENSDKYDLQSGKPLHKDVVASKRKISLQKLEKKLSLLDKKIENRLILTKANSSWLPRFERLCFALSLEPFEKLAILSMISTIVNPIPSKHDAVPIISIQGLLKNFSNNIGERIKYRKYFYKNATLVKEGIITISGIDSYSVAKPLFDLTYNVVEIDRRMMDFVVGLDSEFSEIVEGSNLFNPNVNLDDVILPKEMKTLIVETVSNFSKVQESIQRFQVDKKITYGRGQVILFHGDSGTGKTMLANAIAARLKKKLLLINFPGLGNENAAGIIKLIFRESKIHDAILFFDECEAMFMSRDKGNFGVNTVLTELEKFEGLCILATNRAHELDEAMYRRITLAVDFKKPDHLLREKIWKSLHPPLIPLSNDVNLKELALKFELTGGFIKNCWIMALSFAVSRDEKNPIICHEDLRSAANHQLKGKLNISDFDRKVVPTRGLENCILNESLSKSLSEIVNYVKAESILFAQWGFQKQHGNSKGISALFTGPPGCGKTLGAEAIGFDLGRPLKVVNCSELMSKWVGESGKNIQAVFDEAKANDAVLVFDEAEGLFGSRDSNNNDSRHDTLNVGILLHHIETHPGVCIVITNLKEKIDKAFFRRFKFVLDFTLPNQKEREQILKLLIPKECPISSCVDLTLLSKFELSGGNLKSAIFRAATRCALKPNPEDRKLTMEDLRFSLREEEKKEKGERSDMLMFT